MKSKALIYQSWDDVVFENRNKEYGAYSLRKTYSEKLFLGLLISTGLLALLMFMPSGGERVIPEPPDLTGIIDMTNVPIIEIQPRPQPASRPQETVQRDDVPPQVTTDPVETPVDQPIDQPTQSVNGVEGDGSTGVNTSQAGVDLGITTTIETPKAPDFYLQPEVYPQYENGLAGMAKYLQRNLKYPASAKRMGIEGTVFVSFIVNGDGSISNVEVIRGIHPDCDKEAARVISKMPGWTGGKQAGYPVRVKMVLPIKFTLDR